ncbi:MAG: potassium transporter TrkA [Rhizobiales bacterium]|nr:potassium transporter TrkA [Hyphomicrobiales bacterium]
MAAETLSHYREFLIVLAAAGLIVPLFIRLGISSVLGFLIAGLLLNPDVLDRIRPIFPAIGWLGLSERGEIASLGELGVVFLLFLIGLELSFERLMTMKHLVFGLGGAQVVLTSMVLGAAAYAMGFSGAESAVVGTALSLSSTAIVIQLLSEAKRLGSQTGRTSFAVLLMQDLAVIPILLMVSILGHEDQGPVLQGLLLAIGQAALAIVAIVGIGRYALRPLLRLVAGTNSPDLFLAATLLIAVGTGVAAMAFGLSMALGAFIAGLMLAETEYRRAIEAIIEPFKGLLLGAFFLLVGLGLDLRGLAVAPVRIIAIAIALVAIKAVIVYALARAFKVNRRAALESALLLAPCGEFAFVIIGQALGLGFLDRAESRESLLMVALTMMAIPLLARFGNIAIRKLAPAPVAPGAEPPPDNPEAKVIIAGFGRVGHLIGSMLQEHKIPYIASDTDAALVAAERRKGYPVYYGDATNTEFLRKCGLDQAAAIAVTMDNPARVDDVAKSVRAARADIKIIARARDDRHAKRLYEVGITEAVPEAFEAALQLGEAILVEAGVPVGFAIAAIHEKRDAHRKELGRPNRRAEAAALRRRRKNTV